MTSIKINKYYWIYFPINKKVVSKGFKNITLAKKYMLAKARNDKSILGKNELVIYIRLPPGIYLSSDMLIDISIGYFGFYGKWYNTLSPHNKKLVDLSMKLNGIRRKRR